MAGESTSLGLGGLVRFGIFYDSEAAVGSARPNDGEFVELGLGGLLRVPQVFDAKGSSGDLPRPDINDFIELGLGGLLRVPQVFEAKGAAVGLSGHVSVSPRMSGTVTIGRRYYTTTNIVTSVRSMTSVITYAHKTNVLGSISLSVRPAATQMRYTRFGASNSFNGLPLVTLTPFGNGKYRPFRNLAGAIRVSLTPRSTMAYTPAPLRNNAFSGRPRVTIRPASTITHASNGTAYSFSGSISMSLRMSGIAAVTRETTYSLFGNVPVVRVRMSGTIVHTTGAPRNYSVSGALGVGVRPAASFMGLVFGQNEQHHIDAAARVRVTTQSTITVRRAPSISLHGRRGKRKLIRIFR